MKFEVMATVERDDETLFLSFYVDAENAPEARSKARTIVGGFPSVAVLAEGVNFFTINRKQIAVR